MGYKHTMVIEYPSLNPVVFLFHQGSPNDAKLYEEILEELKRGKNSQIWLYNHLRQGVLWTQELCYGNFQIQSYPGDIPREELQNRKIDGNAFSLKDLHRYTKRSVEKFVCLHVLLVGIVVSLGINTKEELQKIADW